MLFSDCRVSRDTPGLPACHHGQSHSAGGRRQPSSLSPARMLTVVLLALWVATHTPTAVDGADRDPLPRVVPETVGVSSAGLQQATALLDRFVAEQKVAGAVAAVARRGRLVYLEARGVQDIDSRAPMTDR